MKFEVWAPNAETVDLRIGTPPFRSSGTPTDGGAFIVPTRRPAQTTGFSSMVEIRSLIHVPAFNPKVLMDPPR
jgi:hypothetical protein